MTPPPILPCPYWTLYVSEPAITGITMVSKDVMEGRMTKTTAIDTDKDKDKDNLRRATTTTATTIPTTMLPLTTVTTLAV